MRHFRLILIATGLCLFSSLSGAAFGALPEFLNTFPDALTASGGAASLASTMVGVPTVSCTSAEGSGIMTGPKGGTFDELFLGCTGKVAGLTIKCTGLNDTTVGSILVKGTVVLGFELGTLNPVGAHTIEEVHFECGAGNLVLVRGCVVAKLLGTFNVGGQTVFTLDFNQTGGVNELVDYTNDAGAMVACKLEISFSTTSTHTFVQGSLQATLTHTFAKAVELMT